MIQKFKNQSIYEDAFSNNMFQLIAILAFFILGLAFFAIGKDDFGIKRIKEDSNDTSSQKKRLECPEEDLSNKSTQDLEEANSKNESESEVTSEISD